MADGRHAISLIAPLAALSRAEEVASRVGQAIHLGLLFDGEQLPSESEFAPQLGLLRNRLRAMSIGELRDLTDEQSAVSGAAARLAATRASTVSVRRLFALADQLATSATIGARIIADSRFHIEVAIASKSERLTALEVTLQATMAELLWLPLDTAEAAEASGATGADPHPVEPLNPRAAAQEHAAIAAAIEAEDGSRARLLTEEHAEANLHRLTALQLALPPQL
jgi:GntR family transcriptional regulator, transcriptional repressor for pyruvate dehydrogenase complex